MTRRPPRGRARPCWQTRRTWTIAGTRRDVLRREFRRAPHAGASARRRCVTAAAARRVLTHSWHSRPCFSVVIPTFNNVEVLAQCLRSWETHAGGLPVEVIVVEDGCRDATPDYLATMSATPWGRTHLRWLHQTTCTNSAARTPACARHGRVADGVAGRHVPARPLVRARAGGDVRGLRDLGLSVSEPGAELLPASTIRSTRGRTSSTGVASRARSVRRPLNWFRLQEVDGVIRPWVVRRACTDAVGLLDEAFVPTEWDETDLCFRIREAGWRVATHGYERVGAYDIWAARRRRAV